MSANREVVWKRALEELLAIVHRDGGQHCNTHGPELSSKAAVKVVCELREALEEAESEVERLHGLLCWVDTAQSPENVRVAIAAILDEDEELAAQERARERQEVENG